MRILFLLKNNFIHFNILKLPIFLISLKLEKSFSLSNLISDIKGKLNFIKHEHVTFFVISLYPAKSQPSPHISKFFFLYSFLLSFNEISVPASVVKV